MGISFTFVSVFCYIGPVYGYNAIVGAVLIGGIIEGLLGLFAKYWTRLITPIVAASVVTAIGFFLLSVGAASFGGRSGNDSFGSATNWILGTITLLCCLLFNIFAKSYWKQLSVLFGLIVGYIAALCMGIVDFTALKSTSVIALPAFLPFKPEFNMNAIIAVVFIFLVSATETIGDTSALATSGLNRKASSKEISGSLACDGFISALSSLGGCTIMMFGTIVVSGLRMIANCGYSQRNITIVALSLSIGIGFTQVPEIFTIFPRIIQNVFAQNCVATVFLVAIILNLALPKNMEVK